MCYSLLRHQVQKEIFLKRNMCRKNILYQKKKITVKKKLTQNHKIESLISIGADMSVNQW